MERVAFLLEESGERLGALLNPESLEVRRTAGIQPRRTAGGQLTGAGLADDPLLYTGGGRTELDMDLLFDVSLVGTSVPVEDVRALTHPLWLLAENIAGEERFGRPPVIRFVWGKAWNIPGVVAAVAERLERFTPSGIPQRSWLRLRMLRVADQAPFPEELGGDATASDLPATPPLPDDLTVPETEIRVHVPLGDGEDDQQSGERIDQIAARYYGGNPALWRLVARYNQIDDPNRLPAGEPIRIPPVPPPPVRGTT